MKKGKVTKKVQARRNLAKMAHDGLVGNLVAYKIVSKKGARLKIKETPN